MRCIAAGCNTVSGKGYSSHKFPRNESLCTKWTCAVKLQRTSWKGPTAYSVLFSKHFEADCFITEGVRYCDAVGLPAKKQIKPHGIPTIFPKPDVGSNQLITSSQRPASERRKRKAVSTLKFIKHFSTKIYLQIVDEALQRSSGKSLPSTDMCSISQDALVSSLPNEVPMEITDSKQDKG